MGKRWRYESDEYPVPKSSWAPSELIRWDFVAKKVKESRALRVDALAVTKDPERIAVVTNTGAVSELDERLADVRPVGSLSIPQGRTSLRLSRDGSRIVGADGHVARVWKLADGQWTQPIDEKLEPGKFLPTNRELLGANSEICFVMAEK